MLDANEILKASKEYELDNDVDEKSGTSSAEDDSNKENTPPHARKDRMKENSCRSESVDAENEQVPAKEVKKASKKGRKNVHLPSVPASENMEGLIDHVTSHKSKSSKGQDDDKAMHPVNHITKDSALGRAFERIDEESDSEPSDSDNSSSSDSSVSSSESARARQIRQMILHRPLIRRLPLNISPREENVTEKVPKGRLCVISKGDSY